MTTRATWLALAFLAFVSPMLAFPALLGFENMRVAAAVGIAALAVAIGLAQSQGRLAWAVALLAVASVIGWSRAEHHVSTLNHFCGLALGLLTMATVPVFCRTRTRFALATGVFMLVGAATLGVGIRSVTPIHGTKALSTNPLTTPGLPPPLPMPELHSHVVVNPNALGATAMLILPIALAVALAPARWFPLPLALRFAGGLTAAWAAVVVLLTQSRSVWLSVLTLLVLLTRRWMRPRSWWLLVAALAVAVSALIFLASDDPRVLSVTDVVQARAEMWRDGLRALRTSPWFGIGLDYLRDSGLVLVYIAPDRLVGAPHAHNIFLQTALDVGLFGLAGYLAIMVLVLRRAVALATLKGGDTWARFVGVGAGLSVVSVHVYGLLDAVPLGAKVGIFQWLACGLVLAAWRMRAPSEDS